MLLRGVATAALAETLLGKGSDSDVQEAAAAIERLAVVPTDPGFVLNEIALLRLRALLAQARGDDIAYRDYPDRYRDMARPRCLETDDIRESQNFVSEMGRRYGGHR